VGGTSAARVREQLDAARSQLDAALDGTVLLDTDLEIKTDAQAEAGAQSGAGA
jgi:hypothetical protein